MVMMFMARVAGFVRGLERRTLVGCETGRNRCWNEVRFSVGGDVWLDRSNAIQG